METVKQWALAVTISAAAGGIVLILTPDGSVKKSVSAAVSLFLVISMLFPFLKGVDFSDFRIDLEAPEETDLSETVREQMRKSVEKEIRKILEECGITIEGIDIDITVDGEEMRINKIKITAQSGDIDKALKRIKSEIGAEAEIGVVQ